MHFWARGYFVSTVGADEEVARAYIRSQAQEDARLEQLTLFRSLTTVRWSVGLFNNNRFERFTKIPALPVVTN